MVLFIGLEAGRLPKLAPKAIIMMQPYQIYWPIWTELLLLNISICSINNSDLNAFVTTHNFLQLESIIQKHVGASLAVGLKVLVQFFRKETINVLLHLSPYHVWLLRCWVIPWCQQVPSSKGSPSPPSKNIWNQIFHAPVNHKYPIHSSKLAFLAPGKRCYMPWPSLSWLCMASWQHGTTGLCALQEYHGAKLWAHGSTALLFHHHVTCKSAHMDQYPESKQLLEWFFTLQ